MEIKVLEVLNKSNFNMLGLDYTNSLDMRLNSEGVYNKNEEDINDKNLREKQKVISRGIVKLQIISKKIGLKQCKKNAFACFKNNVIYFKEAKIAVQKEIDQLKE